MKTCLNRFLGNCKSCSRDYNPEHHPNNLDCSRYYEIEIATFETIEDQQRIERGVIELKDETK